MHIGMVGPIATSDIAALLDGSSSALPAGYVGAPLLGTLMAELIRRGHQVSAFTLSSDMPLRHDAAVVAQGRSLRLHYLPMRPKAWPPNGWRPGRIVDLYAFERRGLARAIRAAAPEVLHAHWAYEFAWAALATGLPHVITSHDSPLVIARYFRGLKLGGYRRLRAAIAWHVLRRAQRVTTVSPYMVDQIQPLCRVPVAMVPNPIAESAFAFASRRALAPGRQRVMMVCNGWDARKNGQAALQAFALLNARLPAAELVVCGAGFGPDQDAARWWAASGLRGKVQFLGALPHDRILAHMAGSELLLHSSLEESFGAVLAEAMAMGLPVVAGARSGAVPWVVGEGGRLVDVSRPAEMAQALFELLTEPALGAALGRAGRQRVREHFSAAAVASAYELEYQGAALGRVRAAQMVAS